MVFAAPFVAAKPFFDTSRGLIGAVVRIGGFSLGFQQGPGVQMQDAIRAKPEPVPTNRGMPGVTATEIFRCRLFNPLSDSLT